jgi:hypothetical protein
VEGEALTARGGNAFLVSAENHATAALPPPVKNTGYRCVSKFGGPQSGAGRCAEEENYFPPAENRTSIPW